MSAQPYFTVIIAAFNAARWIVSTVRSALAQTYRDFEIVVVGDGCTDATGAILESSFGDAIRWKNLDRNHGSQWFPNNEGIRLARGSHIAYLGHDDVWSPRHLDALAELIRAQDPDFAVSGAVCHGPPGSMHYEITGMFDDAAAAHVEFFPPSSFAHKKLVVERIGAWRDPREVRPPVDCEFLLRAASERCTFASTRTLTVHKFAAGHRYLSYRFPSGAEQERMLDRLGSPEGESAVLREIESEIANGADHAPIRYPDFSRYPAGYFFHRIRRTKGLEAPPPVRIDRPLRLPVESFAAGLDWYDLETGPEQKPFRWSGPNPNPRHLVNVRVRGRFALRLHVLGFARRSFADALAIEIDGRQTSFVRDRNPDGTHVLTIGPVSGPVENGLVLGFRLPRCARLSQVDARRAGLALSSVEVIPVT